ncbi:DoxX family protein [Candidatus Woesearchaeota archaeon]|nr:DoxX family protein [Candidatus Woesearchaeota archaeon]
MGYVTQYVEKYGDYLYVLFRALVGLMFFLHGWDKLIVKKMALGTLFGIAGLVEIVVGIAVVVGFFVRLAAVLGAIQMVVAYFIVHVGNGLSPLANGGELAVLFFSAFLVLIVYGARKWGLEMSSMKKEMF